MIVELNRDDIAKAIEKYVTEEVLGYGKKGEYEIKITQGKSASAKVEMTKIITDISE